MHFVTEKILSLPVYSLVPPSGFHRAVFVMSTLIPWPPYCLPPLPVRPAVLFPPLAPRGRDPVPLIVPGTGAPSPFLHPSPPLAVLHLHPLTPIMPSPRSQTSHTARYPTATHRPSKSRVHLCRSAVRLGVLVWLPPVWDLHGRPTAWTPVFVLGLLAILLAVYFCYYILRRLHKLLQ